MPVKPGAGGVVSNPPIKRSIITISDPARVETLAARASEQLRDGADWVGRLREAGPDSQVARTLRHHVYAYAYPTLLKLIRPRRNADDIFKQCHSLFGKPPVTLTDDEREVLQSSLDERHELALAAMELAWPRFREDLLTKWTAHGGAALTTYFITGCKYRFPDAFRTWRRARQKFVCALPADENIPAADTPHTQVEQRDTLRRITTEASRETQVICQLYLLGYSLADIAAELRVSKNTVSNRMWRLRRKAWAMVDAGMIEAPPDVIRPHTASAHSRRQRQGEKPATLPVPRSAKEPQT